MILPTTLKFISSSLILRELNVKKIRREKKEQKSTRRIIPEVQLSLEHDTSFSLKRKWETIPDARRVFLETRETFRVHFGGP